MHFDPESYIEAIGMPIRQALPKAKPGGDRWRIFETVHNGLRVETFNEKAKRCSPYAVWDEDLYISLYRGFVRLVPQTEWCDIGTRVDPTQRNTPRL